MLKRLLLEVGAALMTILSYHFFPDEGHGDGEVDVAAQEDAPKVGCAST